MWQSELALPATGRLRAAPDRRRRFGTEEDYAWQPANVTTCTKITYTDLPQLKALHALYARPRLPYPLVGIYFARRHYG